MAGSRIVMLTAGSLDARRLAVLLHQAGVEFEIVVFAYPARARNQVSAVKYAYRRAISFVKSLRVLRAFWQSRLPRFPRRTRYVGYCNSKGMLRELGQLSPDYIVMMGGCLLTPAAIATAKIGVLNAHPGLLPWVRGMNVLEHSLLRDVALGATGHFIDVGIDTGPTVLRYLLPVESETNREQLESGLNDLSVGIMFEMVTRAARGEALSTESQRERFPYCRRVSSEDRERADRLMRSGKARELYLKWRREHGEIPDGADALTWIRDYAVKVLSD